VIGEDRNPNRTVKGRVLMGRTTSPTIPDTKGRGMTEVMVT
jgi:hypothetical protein